MNRLLLCVLAVLGAGLTAGTSRAQFGVTAGLNLDRLNDIRLNDREATFENRNGWHIEAWANFGVGPVAVRPGVRYVRAGTLFENLSDHGVPTANDIDISMVEIPVALRFRFPSPVVTPYLLGGPVVRLPSTNDDDLDQDLRTSVAGELGAGLEVRLGIVRLYPEIAFAFGISRFVKDDFSIAGRDFRADDTQRLNSVMLRLGVGL